MLVSEFDFELPEKYIAQKPAEPRESARLLCINGSSKTPLIDNHIYDLPSLLRPNDLLVFNDTKVIPARLFGANSNGAKIELLLLKQLNGSSWEAFAKPGKKLKVDSIVTIADNLHAQVLKKHDNGIIVVRFNVSNDSLFRLIHEHGIMPLPPYIERNQEGKESDYHDYQTIFAKHEGAVAAPTAGLHFTDGLISKIQSVGANTCCVTLHVGAGTFVPVKVRDTNDHAMHSEFCILEQSVIDAINKAKSNGGRIISVGTTPMRVLEAAAARAMPLKPFSDDTDIFITPGYQFNVVDILITNFHLPKSTLFMLVSAFAGLDTMKKAYEYAKEKNYRFYSYGDASFLTRA